MAAIVSHFTPKSQMTSSDAYGAGMFLKGAVYKEYNVEGGGGSPIAKGNMYRATLVKAF